MLRALRLVGMAAQAEGQRMKVQAGAAVGRLGYYAVAGVFGLAALILLHVLLYNLVGALVRGPWGPFWAALAVLAFDAVGALVALTLASRSSARAAEREARMVRDVALAGATEDFFLTAARKGAPWAALGGLAFALLGRLRR